MERFLEIGKGDINQEKNSGNIGVKQRFYKRILKKRINKIYQNKYTSPIFDNLLFFGDCGHIVIDKKEEQEKAQMVNIVQNSVMVDILISKNQLKIFIFGNYTAKQFREESIGNDNGEIF